ncbi:MAG: hypothetical protein HUK22_07455, partial [Thermoguttaceae bacterium]|nr:hypothetical protein [Thermoguttaceae bacterium]
ETPENVALVRLAPCEYYPTTDFLARFDGVGDDCQDDGYELDRAYYRPNDVAVRVEIPDVRAARDAEGRVEFPRFSTEPDDAGRDKIFDKFYLIANHSGAPGTPPEILAGPRGVVKFPSKNREPRVERKSIKGLEVVDFDDAKALGVAHAEKTVDLAWLLSDDENAVEFQCDGRVYRFNRAAVAHYDKFARTATEAGMETTFVLVLWGSRRNLAPWAIHPDFEVWLDAPWALCIAAPDLTTPEKCDRWRALFEFLGSRYCRADRKYGLVSNFVVGNELNSGFIWNNCGRLPLDETVRQYERGLRLAFVALRKYWSGANVLASFDNHWTDECATEYRFEQYAQKGGFTAKDYLAALAAETRAGGDFPWAVAFHPYGLDLRTPVYWDRQSVEATPRNENARRLTPWNIEVLPEFLARPEMRCDGRPRDFYFTEQGYSSPHCDDYANYDAEPYSPDAIPEIWLARQCAAYAFAHYKFVAIGAKANIFHRHQDVRGELLNIGLWARPADAETGAAVKKPIYELFRQIDGPTSLEASAPYLPLLIFHPETTPPASWDALIPNFDAVRESLGAAE